MIEVNDSSTEPTRKDALVMKRLFTLTLGMMTLVLSACTSTPLPDALSTTSPTSQSSADVGTSTEETTLTEEPEPTQEEQEPADDPTPPLITSDHPKYEEIHYQLDNGQIVQCIAIEGSVNMAALSCNWDLAATHRYQILGN